MPASIILHYDPIAQRYSIDSDKSFEVDTDCPDSTILSSLGHVLEKFFVLPHEEFSKLLKINKSSLDPNKPKIREAYAFAKTNLLMTRSQLDCYHDYLPGNGTFDIKTRATIAIRHDRLNHANAAGYQIRTSQGPLESFEREYLDLIRSAFLKYQFQARIGQMDGCFVAYHNTQRVFGFEYLPISKMDQALFGNSQEGDKVFKLCLGYLERILEDATDAYPHQSLRITMSAKSQGNLWVFVSPDQGDVITREPPQDYIAFNYKNYNYLDGNLNEDNHLDLETHFRTRQATQIERTTDGEQLDDEFDEMLSSEEDRERIDWSVFCQTFKHSKSVESDQLYRSVRKIQFAISQLVLPEGYHDQQSIRIIDWPESSKLASSQDMKDDPSNVELDPEDDLSSLSTTISPITRPPNQHMFVPTPGVKYRTEVSKLVKRLRSIAKDGWKAQSESTESTKVIALKPVEFEVIDRQPSLSNLILSSPSSRPPQSSSDSNRSIPSDDEDDEKLALAKALHILDRSKDRAIFHDQHPFKQKL